MVEFSKISLLAHAFQVCFFLPSSHIILVLDAREPINITLSHLALNFISNAVSGTTWGRNISRSHSYTGCLKCINYNIEVTTNYIHVFY